MTLLGTLFCVAEISTDIIEDFLKATSSFESHSHGWCMILQLDQPFTQEPITSTSEITENQFLNKSIETIGNHFLSRMKQEQDKGTNLGRWALRTFAVLDERSARDRTVVMTTRYTPFPPSDWPPDVLPDERWASIRVEFEKACHAEGVLEEAPHTMLEPPTPSENIKDGVFIGQL